MRIGLIGCGEIARRGHLPALRVLKDFKVVALADHDKDSVQRVAREFGITKTYTTARELVEDKTVEAVVATVPPQAYKDIVSLAASHHKPILLEKPLASTVADAQAIVKQVKESGIKAGVVQNYRYYAALGDIRDRISIGRIGKPVSVHLLLHQHSPLSWSLSPWRFEGPRGVLDDIGVHAFDSLLWLTKAEPKTVFAFGVKGLPGANFLNQVSTMVKFQSGLISFVDLSWLTGPMTFRVNALGTGGRIFSDILFNQVQEQHGHPLPISDLELLTQKSLFILKGIVNGDLFTGTLKFYQYLYQDFLKYVNNENFDFPGVETALKTVKIMDAVAQSLTIGSTVHL